MDNNAVAASGILWGYKHVSTVHVHIIEILHLEPTCRLPYIHGSRMVCTWRPLVEKFCILLWQARVGRKVERYVREREEEIRMEQGRGVRRALSLKLNHWGLG
jgi:hypothetical protein